MSNYSNFTDLEKKFINEAKRISTLHVRFVQTNTNFDNVDRLQGSSNSSINNIGNCMNHSYYCSNGSSVKSIIR